MAQVCQVTGKTMQVGNSVSHSNRKTKRRFLPNLNTKKFFIPEENRWVTLKVSAHGMRTIDKLGIAESLKRAKAAGHYKD